MSSIPVKQPNHRYLEILEPAFFDWLDIHFGEHSFEGVVTIGHKGRKKGDPILVLKSCRITELNAYLREMHISTDKNYYLAANTVTADKRQLQYLFSLNNIVIDIDCHDERFTPQEISTLVEALIWRAKRDYWNEDTFPQPNSIVRTGRGVQFWWAIKPCAAATVWYYDQIKAVFLQHFAEMVAKHEELKGLLVDISPSKNNVGFFRLPGTYNTGVKKYSTIEIIHKGSYSTHHLFEIIKPRLSKKSSGAKSKKQVAPRLKTHAEKSAIALEKSDLDFLKKCQYQCGRRIAKFIQLRNLRDKNIGAESRDLFCLIVYCELRKVYDHDQALNYLRQFNDGFKEPFDDDRLQKKISTAKDVCYCYSNQRIIEVLNITPEEQEQINFFPAESTGWVQRRPNASRDEVRRIKREGRDAKIIELYKEGLSRAEIGRELGINRKTAATVVNKWIEKQNAVEKGGDQKEFHKCIASYQHPQEEELPESRNTQEDTPEIYQASSKDTSSQDALTGTTVLVSVVSPWAGVDLAKPIAKKKGLLVYKGGDSPNSS